MKKLLLLFGIATAIVSCSEKESVEPAQKSTEKLGIKQIELEKGVLKFSSKKHLQNVISELTNVEDRVNWYPNSGFSSLLKRQQAITEAEYEEIGSTGKFGDLNDVLFLDGKGDEKSIEKIVEDERFAAVLNAEGYVVIADTAYRVGLSKTSYIPISGNAKILAEFLKNPAMEKSGFLTCERSSKQYVAKLEQRQASGKGLRTDDYQNTNGNRRVIAEFKHHNAGIYESLVVKLEFKKKNWIGWSGTNAGYMEFSASGFAWQGMQYNQFPFSGSRSGQNVEEISMFIVEGVNVSCGWAQTSGHGYVSDSGNIWDFNF